MRASWRRQLTFWFRSRNTIHNFIVVHHIWKQNIPTNSIVCIVSSFHRREWLRYLERHPPQDPEPCRRRARLSGRQLLHKSLRRARGAGNMWEIKPKKFLWWKARESMLDKLTCLTILLFLWLLKSQCIWLMWKKWWRVVLDLLGQPKENYWRL